MSAQPDLPLVLVAVPARDEEDEIAACLRHLLVAAEVARGAGVARVVVGVGAHRCRDRTREVAARVLERAPLSSYVLEDEESTSVGAARGRLVRDLARRVGAPAWVFSTDADSWVPPDWITSTLAQAERGGADAVAGLVTLRGWHAPARLQEAYRAILRRGFDGAAHHHVYAANLAVRWSAYDAVGGFAAGTSEDHDLVRRLGAAGHRVLTATQPRVLTSAREVGRAPVGLAALLATLRAEG